jgi:hypothetical protein
MLETDRSPIPQRGARPVVYLGLLITVRDKGVGIAAAEVGALRNH